MARKLFLLLVALMVLPQLGHSQDAKATLDAAVKAMGDVKTLQITGSGANYSFGQAVAPGQPWPKFTVKSITRTIDYETPALRDEIVRTQAEPNARGGGGIPLPGEQKQVLSVAGTSAWNQVGDAPPTPAVAAVHDRLHQLWITPHGVIKAAIKHNATAATDGGKKVITFTVPGELKVKAWLNDKDLIEKVESWSPNPVLGDTQTDTVYADCKDFGGAQFPTKITQKAGGFPTLELAVTEVKANVPAGIQAPDNIRQAAVKVDADKVADGVWYLTGGTHHSVLIEMNDHLIVVEGPVDDARALAV